MGWLRTLVSSLRLWLYGPGELLPAADVEINEIAERPRVLLVCTHPRWSACIYRAWARVPGWYRQCLSCGQVFIRC